MDGEGVEADEFSQEAYAAIGRVAVAAANVEFGLAILVAILESPNNAPNPDGAFAIAERTGEAMRRARSIGARLRGEVGVQWNALINEASEALNDRHRIIHAVWSRQSDSLQMAGYVGRHSKTDTEVDANPAQIRPIADGLVKVQDDIFWMISKLALILGDALQHGRISDVSQLNPDLAAIDARVDELRRRSEEPSTIE